MKSKNGSKIDELRRLAKDLTQEEPRPAEAELAGFQGAARTLDK